MDEAAGNARELAEIQVGAEGDLLRTCRALALPAGRIPCPVGLRPPGCISCLALQPQLRLDLLQAAALGLAHQRAR